MIYIFLLYSFPLPRRALLWGGSLRESVSHMTSKRRLACSFGSELLQYSVSFFTRENSIETRYEVLHLNVKLGEVQLPLLRAIFHTSPLFYLQM